MTGKSDGSGNRGLGPAWLSAIAALISAIVGLVAFLATRANPGESSAPSATTSQAVAPASPVHSGPATTQAAGRLLTHYRIDISSGYGINFGSSPPQPVPIGQLPDLEYDADLIFYSLGDGRMAALSSTSASFADCKNDTRYTDHLTLDPTGEIVCFTGHGVIAAATLLGRHTDPTDVVTFDVRVWQDPQS